MSVTLRGFLKHSERVGARFAELNAGAPLSSLFFETGFQTKRFRFQSKWSPLTQSNTPRTPHTATNFTL